MSTNPRDLKPTVADWIAASLLTGTSVVAPLALGATAPWLRLMVELATALAVAAWALSSNRGCRSVWLPIAIAGVFMLQLVPLPDSILTFVSPVAVGAWKVALADHPMAWGRITVDPAATAAAIRRLLLAAATVLVVVDLGRHTQLRRLLCGGLCVVCVTIWSLGLLFPFQRKEVLLLGFIDFKGPIATEFWKTPIEPPISTNGSGNLERVTVGGERYESAMWIAADGFGPYIYANHFAGALCLTVPAVLGAWLVATRRRIPNGFRHAGAALVFGAAVWTAGIAATSRAGAAGMILAALVFASLTLERLWARRLATTLCAAYVCVVFAFLVALYGNVPSMAAFVPEPFHDRVAAMLSDTRALAARTALRMFLAAPALGSGLGTFGDLFPRFLRTDFLLNYAHNDYAQWLAETGIVGALFAAGFSWMLITAFRRWWKTVIRLRQGDPLTAGLWAGLAGIGLHTAFDWNLHIPANALLACVAAGLALAAGAADHGAIPPQPPAGRSYKTRLPGAALAVACLLAAAFLTRDAASDAVQRELRKAIVAARVADADPKAPLADVRLETAASSGERMFRWDSGNGRLAVLIGLTKLHLAVMPSHRTDAAQERASAGEWLAQARLCSAVCRGLPEPIALKPDAAPSP